MGKEELELQAGILETISETCAEIKEAEDAVSQPLMAGLDWWSLLRPSASLPTIEDKNV